MTKGYWTALGVGLSIASVILWWHISDSSKIGLIDYHANKEKYRTIEEEIKMEPRLRVIDGKILVGVTTICAIAESNCPEKYSRFIKAVKSAQIVEVAVSKRLGILEVRTEKSEDTPLWSTWSERYYIYDPSGVITGRIIQDYGNGWKLTHNYIFDIEQR